MIEKLYPSWYKDKRRVVAIAKLNQKRKAKAEVYKILT